MTETVSGFGAPDIDLPQIAFNPVSTLGYSPNTSQMGGALTFGGHGPDVALLSNYMASSFANETLGGTMGVVESPQAAEQSLLSNPHHT
jgi:hypothetical protein